jgi:hypothetical protein
MEILSLLQVRRSELPVHQLPKGFEVGRPGVAVVDVVGVFPDVTISAGSDSSFRASDVAQANSETCSAGMGSGSASSIRMAGHRHQIG